ncbi:MAG: hypothetical protein GY789_07710 [Hyphomicrobiales bacterium]|nr:hypothetical protein [Hyphomicrobiales bacterium]
MTYKKTFDLNLLDIDIIETCLRNELHIRAQKYQGSAKENNPKETESLKQGISKITELLGKIHDQKIWYDGDPSKPSVPKG